MSNPINTTTVPNLTEIISWYLYGQTSKPDNVLDDQLIGRDHGATVTIDALEYNADARFIVEEDGHRRIENIYV